jgi:hydroxymethylbilane synthase
VVTRLVAEAVHHPMDARRVAAERAFLARLHGGCQTPLAAHAIYRAGELLLEGLVGKPDGSTVLRSRVHGHPDRAEELGAELAEELLSRGAGAILEACGGTPVS